MTTVNHRHERIGEEIAHEINAMLAGELKDPRLEISVVVNQVLIAQDMRHARVLVGARGTQAEQKGVCSSGMALAPRVRCESEHDRGKIQIPLVAKHLDEVIPCACALRAVPPSV